MTLRRDIVDAHRNEQGEAFAEALRTAELAILADAFCERMAANNFDLDHLPAESLEKLRNASMAMASQCGRTIAERYHELLADHVAGE